MPKNKTFKAVTGVTVTFATDFIWSPIRKLFRSVAYLALAVMAAAAAFALAMAYVVTH